MVEEVQAVAEAAGPLARLGVDWRLLVAQLVNFGVVLFVMWKWVYRPLLKVMDERAKKIEQGLKDAAAASADRQGAGAEKDQIVTAARLQSKEIIEEAERLAKELHGAQVAKARQEVEAVVKQGKTQLQADKAAMLAEAKGELAGLVTAAAEKVIAAKLDASTDAAFVKRALEGEK